MCINLQMSSVEHLKGTSPYTYEVGLDSDEIGTHSIHVKSSVRAAAIIFRYLYYAINMSMPYTSHFTSNNFLSLSYRIHAQGK